MTYRNVPIGVLFVCMGNICRSPAGEGVFRHYVSTAGYDRQIHIDSAGIIDYHAGDPPDYRMREAAAKRGYKLNSVARRVTQEDIREFDLIVPMDHDNLYDLERIAGGPHSYFLLLGSFIPGNPENHLAPPVPDPYYGGSGGFEKVLDMVESACPAMLDHCLSLLQKK